MDSALEANIYLIFAITVILVAPGLMMWRERVLDKRAAAAAEDEKPPEGEPGL